MHDKKGGGDVTKMENNKKDRVISAGIVFIMFTKGAYIGLLQNFTVKSAKRALLTITKKF